MALSQVETHIDGVLCSRITKASELSDHKDAGKDKKFALQADGAASIASRFAFPSPHNDESYPNLYEELDLARTCGSIYMRSLTLHSECCTIPAHALRLSQE